MKVTNKYEFSGKLKIDSPGYGDLPEIYCGNDNVLSTLKQMHRKTVKITIEEVEES